MEEEINRTPEGENLDVAIDHSIDPAGDPTKLTQTVESPNNDPEIGQGILKEVSSQEKIQPIDAEFDEAEKVKNQLDKQHVKLNMSQTQNFSEQEIDQLPVHDQNNNSKNMEIDETKIVEYNDEGTRILKNMGGQSIDMSNTHIKNRALDQTQPNPEKQTPFHSIDQADNTQSLGQVVLPDIHMQGSIQLINQLQSSPPDKGMNSAKLNSIAETDINQQENPYNNNQVGHHSQEIIPITEPQTGEDKNITSPAQARLSTNIDQIQNLKSDTIIDMNKIKKGTNESVSTNNLNGAEDKKKFVQSKDMMKTMTAIEIQEADEKEEQEAEYEKKDDQSTTGQIDEFKANVGVFLNTSFVQTLMFLVTLYALLGDDIRLLAFPKSLDDTFIKMTIASLFLFLIELTLASIGQPDYLGSFFFWLDLISTLSIITDIPPIMDAMTGSGGTNATDEEQDDAGDAASLARASRGARIGTKAGRMTRVIRLIRLIRVVKLYKSATQAQTKEDQKQKDNNADPVYSRVDALQSEAQNKSDLNNALQEKQESKVGKKLSDFTTRKVIILVLAMLFSQPLTSVGTYIEQPSSFEYGLNLIQALAKEGLNEAAEQSFQDLQEIQGSIETPAIFIVVNHKGLNDKNGLLYYNQDLISKDFKKQKEGVDAAEGPDLAALEQKLQIDVLKYIDDTFRKAEKEVVSIESDQEGDLYLIIYDLRGPTKVQAVCGLGTTFLVCMVLGSGAMIFSKLTTDLVITPIEDMIERVNGITVDPIKAAHDEEERLLYEELAEKAKLETAQRGVNGDVIVGDQKKKEKPMETEMLEQTLSKIGALLAVGFGEAGSRIIATNMALGDDVNPMMPGTKLFCIYGFCDIRNFTDATEVLQEGVMLFVNEIGGIVHEIIDSYSGAANKNIGDAFLLVWKLEEQDMVRDKKTGDVQAKKCQRVAQLADMSLLSFIILIAALKKSRKMTKYNIHKGLNERMPGYQVKLGLGLHMGYSIEGALGSYYKIDATYLSPHVNMAARLEGATKAFGVPLLVHQALYNGFTRKVKAMCRCVDFVLMSGSDVPQRLYTFDIESERVGLEPEQPHLTAKEMKIERVRNRIKRNSLREAAFNSEIEISQRFEKSIDVVVMRKGIKKAWITEYNTAFDLYVKGKWEEAIAGFNKSLELYPKDPLAKKLLKYMEDEHNNTPPEDWKGYKFFQE